MRNTLVIAQRELAEKSFVLIAAAAMVVVVLLTPFIPGVQSNRREVLVVASSILAVGFSFGLTIILGATIVGRELTERRLSFYFARPIAAPAIWLGKLVASAILIVATFLIVIAPGFFTGTVSMQRVWSGQGREFLVPLAIAASVAFFVAHVLSTIARSRSAWAAIDLVAAVLLGTAGWLIVRPLVDAGAFAMLLLILKTGGWLLLIAAILAGAWQLAVGRTDRQQSHYAMSRFLWPAVAVALAICGAIVLWVVSPQPADLIGSMHARIAPEGDFAFITGEARHRRDYQPVFLMNVRTGGYERIGSPGPMFDSYFIARGRKVLLLRPIDRRTGTMEVFIRDVSKGSREQATGLTVGRWTWPIDATEDVQRIAYVNSNVLGVYDVPQKSSLGSVRLANTEYVAAMWFVTPDLLRIYTVSGARAMNEPITRDLHIFEYDLSSRVFRQTGGANGSTKYFSFSASGDGSRLIVREREGSAILDARTGARLLTISSLGSSSILSDGRIAGIDHNVLRIFSPSGAPQRAIPLDSQSPDEFWFTREIGSGRMLVGGKRAKVWSVVLVDINSGTIVRHDSGLMPLFVGEGYTSPKRRVPLNPNQLFSDAHGTIVRWNPITNEKNVLVPGRS